MNFAEKNVSLNALIQGIPIPPWVPPQRFSQIFLIIRDPASL